MINIQSRKSKIIVTISLVVISCLLILGLLYLNYARSESSDMVSDIPGTVITTPAPVTTQLNPATTPPQVDSPMTVPMPAQMPVAPEPRNPKAVISGVEGRRASGDVTIITTTEGTFIRLEDNFDSSRAAPDNRIYLGNAEGRQIEIAKLKAPSGGQNFRVPDSVNIKDYTFIWIHCKAYNTTYGSGQILF